MSQNCATLARQYRQRYSDATGCSSQPTHSGLPRKYETILRIIRISCHRREKRSAQSFPRNEGGIGFHIPTSYRRLGHQECQHLNKLTGLCSRISPPPVTVQMSFSETHISDRSVATSAFCMFPINEFLFAKRGRKFFTSLLMEGRALLARFNATLAPGRGHTGSWS